MREDLKSPWVVLALVLGWRFLLLVLTQQPIPGNDAFLFDGAVVNRLLYGQYVNPSLAECFPISGHQVFAAYPPVYQGLLLPWMSVFGTSALSAMWFHFLWSCVAGVLVVKVLIRAWGWKGDAGASNLSAPSAAGASGSANVESFAGAAGRTAWLGLAVLFLFAITFDDRPEGLAHVFGLIALLLTVRKPAGQGTAMALGKRRLLAGADVVLALFCSLYTSLVVGALYCGVTILTRIVGWARFRSPFPWTVALGVVTLFSLTTFWIAQAHPLWWQGFLENARQTPVSTKGFRLPEPVEVIKVVRNAPVFLVAFLFVPWMWRSLLPSSKGAEKENALHSNTPAPQHPNTPADHHAPAFWGPALTVAVSIAGWLLLAGCLLLFTANYVSYLWYVQVLLAGGLTGAASALLPRDGRSLTVVMTCFVVLVSVRALGLTTWGALCATDVSYQRAQRLVHNELQPLVRTGARPVVSSAFLYEAARTGVRGAIHTDWPYDRRGVPAGSDLALMNRLRPAKLVLTQFDYYRVYAPLVHEFGRHPELCSVEVRNMAKIPAPDASRALQRVLQHVSWAPVIVDFQWK